jgi:hypothetical protein
MDEPRSQFLTSMINILDRLQETCVDRGEPLLGSVLAIAKGEAEDALRHAEELAELNALRESMSSRTTWRASDQGQIAEGYEAANEAYAGEAYGYYGDEQGLAGAMDEAAGEIAA